MSGCHYVPVKEPVYSKAVAQKPSVLRKNELIHMPFSRILVSSRTPDLGPKQHLGWSSF